MESASEGTYLIDASNNIDTMSVARQQRRQNQQMGNTIRNVSNSNEFRI
jgi:replicative DNA helicase